MILEERGQGESCLTSLECIECDKTYEKAKWNTNWLYEAKAHIIIKDIYLGIYHLRRFCISGSMIGILEANNVLQSLSY